MVGALVLTWALGRIVERLRDRLALVSGLVQRVGASVIFCFVAAQAAKHGGYWLILVPLLGLLALFGFALSAGIVWVWTRHGLDDSA